MKKHGLSIGHFDIFLLGVRTSAPLGNRLSLVISARRFRLCRLRRHGLGLALGSTTVIAIAVGAAPLVGARKGVVDNGNDVAEHVKGLVGEAQNTVAGFSIIV